MAKSKTYTFYFPYSDRIDAVLEIAHAFAKTPNAVEKKVIFRGDRESGYLETKKTECSYTLINEEITLTIEKKPLFIPWKLIDKQIDRFASATHEEVDNLIAEMRKYLTDAQ